MDCNGIFLSWIYRGVMHGSNFSGWSHLNYCWVRQRCRMALGPKRERDRETVRGEEVKRKGRASEEERDGKKLWKGNKWREFKGNKQERLAILSPAHMNRKVDKHRSKAETAFSHQSVANKCCLLPALLSLWHTEFLPLTGPHTLFSSSLTITSVSTKTCCSLHQAWKRPKFNGPVTGEPRSMLNWTQNPTITKQLLKEWESKRASEEREGEVNERSATCGLLLPLYQQRDPLLVCQYDWLTNPTVELILYWERQLTRHRELKSRGGAHQIRS